MQKEKTKSAEDQAIEQIVKENEAQLVEWKDRHKYIKAIAVHSELLGKWFPYIIAKPTASVMSAVQKYEHEGKMDKVEEVLTSNCVKAGDKKVFTEDIDIKTAVYGKVFDLFKRLEVSEKEL